MATLQIHDENIIQRLRKLAVTQNQSAESLLQHLLDQYEFRQQMREAMAGMFDDDIPDLSTIDPIYTFDRRDFLIFRPHHCNHLELIP
jgi:hypothetical protein